MINFIHEKDIEKIPNAPLTDEEVSFIKAEIHRIGADEAAFVFDKEEVNADGAFYDFKEDKIYVTGAVIHRNKYGSDKPRDRMSVGAVLAYEYFGIRKYGDKGADITWRDRCQASIDVAKTTPNLTDKDKSDLVMNAVSIAKEYGYLIEMDGFMKAVVYGVCETTEGINCVTPINYVKDVN